jgi:hypothetical protein
MLETTFKGYQGGQAVFQAISPDGLSTFGLIALAPSSFASINWMPIIGGVSGGSGIMGTLAYFFAIRGRRVKDAVLRKKWPTGMRPDDWECQ